MPSCRRRGSAPLDGPSIFRYQAGANGSSSGLSAIPITLANQVNAGDTLIVVYTGASNVRLLSSVTDTEGNAWQVDQTASAASAKAIGIAHAYITNPLKVGDTVTCNVSGGSTTFNCFLFSFNGPTNFRSGATATAQSGTLSVLDGSCVPGDVVIGAYVGSASGNQPAGWTSLALHSNLGSCNLTIAYKIAQSFTETYALTSEGSSASATAIAAYH